MVGGKAALVLTLFVLAASQTPEARSTDIPTAQSITVALCDKASVSPEDWQKAKETVDQIFSSRNLSINWFDQSCTLPRGDRYFSVFVLSKAPEGLRSGDGALGAALVPNGGILRAYIFFDRVVEFDRSKGSGWVYPGIILGHAIAHELGHLLGEPHSLEGIMRAVWTRADWSDAVHQGMKFINRPGR
jgi:hypothetical protein